MNASEKNVVESDRLNLDSSRNGTFAQNLINVFRSLMKADRPSPLAREISCQEATRKVQSLGQEASNSERIIISFHSTDPENPNNWPTRKKVFVVIVGLLNVTSSTLGSSLPSNAITFISEDFQITSDLQRVLPISVFLIGYILGPLVFSPLSEQYGRKPILVPTFLLFTIFSMACALAPTFNALIIFRFFCGVNAAAPIAIVGGLYADVYHDPRKRGYALAWFMVVRVHFILSYDMLL